LNSCIIYLERLIQSVTKEIGHLTFSPHIPEQSKAIISHISNPDDIFSRLLKDAEEKRKKQNATESKMEFSFTPKIPDYFESEGISKK
jgi:hypothetical protein